MNANDWLGCCILACKIHSEDDIFVYNAFTERLETDARNMRFQEERVLKMLDWRIPITINVYTQSYLELLAHVSYSNRCAHLKHFPFFNRLCVVLHNRIGYVSEKLEAKMFGYRNMRAPLNNLQDCDGCGYALQLSLYQYIIEKYYGMKVSGRALASIHPTKPFTTATPYLEKEVEYLMPRKDDCARPTRERPERQSLQVFVE